jgi:hypothetical protein
VVVPNQKGFDRIPPPRRGIPVLPRRHLPGGSKRLRAIAVNRSQEARKQPNTESVIKEIRALGEERG